MSIYVGSARIDENGNTTGGEAGDQTGKEVSTQAMYTHSKGWYILRPKSVTHANALAKKMQAACDNDHIGYDQNQRLGIISKGISTTTDTECDCSSLVRECIIEAMGTDPGNFTTSNEVTKLAATGLFEDKISYTSQAKTPVYNGDILVTKTKGHTVIVVSGNARSSTSVTATAKAASYSASLAGTYTVTASSLNVRNGAGTNYTVMTTISKGTTVKCYGYYSTASSVKWLYIQFTKNGTTYTGFASSKYLT